MKKLILILLFAPALFSCQKEETVCVNMKCATDPNFEITTCLTQDELDLMRRDCEWGILTQCLCDQI